MGLVLLLALAPGCVSAASSKVKILMYHSLTTDATKVNSCTVTAEKFEADLRYLQENHYNVVLPSELTAGTVPDKTVVITFDDGYKDFYELVYPLLVKYEMKACVSVVCSLIGVHENFLTWDQCREMTASGLVEIGSHTYNLHNPATNGVYVNGKRNGVQHFYSENAARYKARVLNDIQKSYDVIKEETGITPVTFSYPYGQKDAMCNQFVKGLFRVTLLTSNGYESLENNLHNLKRYSVGQETSLVKILGK